MEVDFSFPFELFNDDDFITYALGDCELGNEGGISLSDLEKLCFSPLNEEADAYMGDVNPDTFLEGCLGFSKPDKRRQL